MIALAGLGVGVLTGFFGVGGGFMIVPVLTRRARARVPPRGRHLARDHHVHGRRGAASHLATGAAPDVAITASLAASTAVGAAIGTAVAGRLPQQALARGFATIVTVLALLLLADVLLLDGPPTA